MNLKDKLKKVFKSKKNIFTFFALIFILIFLFNLITIEQEKNYINVIQQKIDATPQKSFVNIGTMNVSRKEHIAIKLQDGKIFIAGGTYNNYSEIYNPNTYQFQKKARLIGIFPVNEFGMQGILLKNGNILIGGASCLVLYDYKKNCFTTLKDYKSSALQVILCMLKNGEVLVTGTGNGDCRIYNPYTGKFLPVDNINKKRLNYTSTLLPNGNVLIAGGNNLKENNGKFYALKTAEIYNPVTNNFTKIGNMNFTHALHTATLLKNGKVLIVGGNKNAELYDYKTNKFYITTKTILVRKRFHTATLLKNGNVLVVGGDTENKEQVGPLGKYYVQLADNAEIYDAKKNKFYKTGKLKYPAIGHQATLLDDGKVLITGGTNAGERAELYIP